jgi:phosphatidylglycerophosphatase A
MQLKKIAYTIATGFGSGYSPLIPGTAGSFIALIIFVLVPLDNASWLIICLIVFFTGVWAAKIVEKEHGKDPGLVVIDEFVGQWISLLFLPRIFLVFIAAFIIFRILDILKPFPANDSQKLAHGWGIMIDDVIAGIYTNVIIQLILFFLKDW